jgi:hypothetical protein
VLFDVLLQIVGARHVIKSGRGIASPFVEIEVIGCSYDSNKYKTSVTGKRLHCNSCNNKYQMSLFIIL